MVFDIEWKNKNNYNNILKINIKTGVNLLFI